MKHLSGKKLNVSCISGTTIIGLCTGATDEIIKILPKGAEDETVIFIKNVFSYTIIGGKTTGGYSGLKVYVCKNEDISCKGRIRLSMRELLITDMGCEVCRVKTADGKTIPCDFGCLGAMEILPSNVQSVFFDGMLVAKIETKRGEK